MHKPVHWVHPVKPEKMFNFGYVGMNRQLIKYTQLAGMEHTRTSEIAVHVISPSRFRPVRKKYNVCFTMWESADFPKDQHPYLSAADLIIVPTHFVQKIFKDAGYDSVIVPLGIEPDTFPKVRRVWQPGEPFMWLNVGAANARKGWDVLERVWNDVFARRDDCFLYMKTVAPEQRIFGVMNSEGWKRKTEGVWYRNNAILDVRKLPEWAMVQTYNNAHGFAFPTAGEGFGLTLLEAMSTGLPCITTKYSGVMDFTSQHTVKYVGYDPQNVQLRNKDGSGTVINSALAKPDEVAQQMQWIMSHYTKALQMGKRASQVARTYSWKASAKKLCQIIDKYSP